MSLIRDITLRECINVTAEQIVKNPVREAIQFSKQEGPGFYGKARLARKMQDTQYRSDLDEARTE